MGMRFKKSKSILPGVRLNVNKGSVSMTVGSKGMRQTFSTTGKKTTTVSLPGTGISYTTAGKTKKKKAARASDFYLPSTVSNTEPFLKEEQTTDSLDFFVPPDVADALGIVPKHLHEEKPVNQEGDGQEAELLKLFRLLTPEQQAIILLQIKGVLSNQ